MRRLFIVFLCLLALFPAPTEAQQDAPASFLIAPDLQQGQASLIYVYAADLIQAQVIFINKPIALYPTNVEGQWVGLLGVDLETPPGTYRLDISLWTHLDQSPQQYNQSVPVAAGNFVYEAFDIPDNLGPLLDNDLNQQEQALLRRIYDRVTPERLFKTFATPIEGSLTSDFGGIRSYNGGQLQGRHTGADILAGRGVPVRAAADGRVVFGDLLPIHGNHVIIDHGWGVLSGYSHLRQIVVTPGQLVRQGHVIGFVGNTGRTQGPHLHFELTVNGYWVDPVQFLSLAIPLEAP